MSQSSLILCVTFVLAGTVLLLLGRGEAMAAVMITGAAAALGKGVVDGKKLANQERDRADRAIEETQTLRRDQLGK